MMLTRFAIFCLLLALVFTNLAAPQATQAASKDQVKTAAGTVGGTVAGSSGVREFKGVPKGFAFRRFL